MKSPAILVIDDDSQTRELFRLALELEGYTVFEAEDGHTALDLATQHDLSLILQDLMLPDVNGFELVGKLHSLSAAPILAVSGLLAEVDGARLLAAGFTDFIAKPVGLKALSELVRTHLAKVEASG